MTRRRSISQVRVCVCRHYREQHPISHKTGYRDSCHGLTVKVEGENRNVSNCKCTEFDEQETA